MLYHMRTSCLAYQQSVHLVFVACLIDCLKLTRFCPYCHLFVPVYVNFDLGINYIYRHRIRAFFYRISATMNLIIQSLALGHECSDLPMDPW